MTVSWLICGAQSPTGFTASAKTTATSARLAVSTSPTMSSPTYYGPVTPTNSVAKIAATGRAASTDYWYAIEENGVLNTSKVGKVRTFPTAGSPASYRVAVSSCAGPSSSSYLVETGVSNSPAFDHIRDTNPLLFVHEGDLHYKNFTTNDQAQFRAAFDAVFSASHQAGLYQSCALAYIPDDHDTGGNDSSGTTSPARPAWSAVYRERIPSHTIPAGPDAPLYHAWTIGRVQFVFTDTRWARSPDSDPDGPSKTMLGSAQKTWFEGILASSTSEALVWLNPTPWMGLAGDTWAGFTTERDEIRDMLVAHGWMDRMVIVNGDNHSNGMDTGGGNAVKTGATCPVWMWGSIDSPSTSSSTQYDMGATSPGVDRYGTIDVLDTGDQIALTGTGYIGTEPWRQFTLTIPTGTTATAPQSLALLYDDTLSRIRLDAHGLALGTESVDIDRSTNQINWAPVRGGLGKPVAATVTTSPPQNTNPFFETDAAGWVMSSGDTIARSTAQHHEGAAAALVTSDGSGASLTCSTTNAVSPPAQAGVNYTASCWVYSTAGWSQTEVGLVWIDGADATISVTFGTVTNVPAATWTQLAVTAEPPVGAVKVGLRLAMLNTPGAGVAMWMDEAQVTFDITDNHVRLDDYEFTPDVPNYYRLQMLDGDGEVLDTIQAVTTPAMDAVWLKSASRPYLNQKVAVVDMGQVSRSTRGGVFQVSGRRLPIAVSELMTSRAFTLTVLTDTLEEATDLDALLSLGEPVLVHVPQACPIPLPTMYASVGDWGSDRIGRLSPVQTLDLPLTEIAPPGPDIVGVTITWSGVVSAYASWGDLIADLDDWAAVLDQIGGTDDVVVG